ncbi:MFS transporter [Streptodolium elevatio]
MPTAKSPVPASLPEPAPVPGPDTEGRSVPGSGGHTPAPDAPAHWSAVVGVALGIFTIVTSEILPIGMLTGLADDFGVSDGRAGLLMTLPGVLAALCAPLVAVAVGRVDRRIVLTVLMALLVLANLLTACAPAFWVVLVARALVGLVIGGFWSIGAGLAPRLVPAASVATATAVVFAAVPAGSVLGVPAGTLLGQHVGRRAAFVVLAALALAVAVLLATALPALPVGTVTRPRTLAALLRTRGVRAGLAVTGLIVVGHFAAYTYVTAFLRDTTHVDGTRITVFLLLYGAAGVAGNFVAGVTLARGPRATFAASAIGIAAAVLLFPVLGRSWPGAVGLLVVWGFAYGAVPAASQTWFARSAPNAPEAAMVVFTSSFQATLAGGALLGGVVVDATSASAVMVLSGVVCLATAATVALSAGPKGD